MSALPSPARHTQVLLPLADSMLTDGGVSLSQLDGIAFGRGPGSFTGLRIAAGIVQALAFAADLPVAPVSTLALLAQGVAWRHRQVIVMQDARLNQRYIGIYRLGDNKTMTALTEDYLSPPTGWSLPEGEWFGVGDGWCDATVASARSQSNCRLLGVDRNRRSTAADMLPLVLATSHDIWRSADEAVPVYLRDALP